MAWFPRVFGRENSAVRNCHRTLPCRAHAGVNEGVGYHGNIDRAWLHDAAACTRPLVPPLTPRNHQMRQQVQPTQWKPPVEPGARRVSGQGPALGQLPPAAEREPPFMLGEAGTQATGEQAFLVKRRAEGVLDDEIVPLPDGSAEGLAAELVKLNSQASESRAAGFEGYSLDEGAEDIEDLVDLDHLSEEFEAIVDDDGNLLIISDGDAVADYEVDCGDPPDHHQWISEDAAEIEAAIASLEPWELADAHTDGVSAKQKVFAQYRAREVPHLDCFDDLVSCGEVEVVRSQDPWPEHSMEGVGRRGKPIELHTIARLLLEEQGEQITMLQLDELERHYSDYVVLVTGKSKRHLRAMSVEPTPCPPHSLNTPCHPSPPFSFYAVFGFLFEYIDSCFRARGCLPFAIFFLLIRNVRRDLDTADFFCFTQCSSSSQGYSGRKRST